MNSKPRILPPNYRWNFRAFLVDYASFAIAMAFISISSVLPAFVGELTDSKPVIGLVSTVFKGSWLLPQLVAASLIIRRPRKKPYLLAGIAGRLFLGVIALALWVGLARYRAAMLALFFACLGLWAATDGLASVSWFDILARAIPLERRGRLIGTGQFLSGLAGIGVGALVTLIIAHRPFPGNYALLFTLAAAVLIPSAVALASVREPRPERAATAHLDAIGNPLRLFRRPFADPMFRHLLICRILIGLGDLATPFYVDHAKTTLLLPERIVGYFVMAQTVAGVVASATLGLVAERWGPRRVAAIGSAVAAGGPLFALVAHLAGGGWLAQAYPIVYVSLGIINSAWMLGFLSYLMEIAPETLRPAYIGAGNTVMGLVVLLAPMAGGWLLEATSYSLLFGLTGAILAIGFVFTLGLKSPQHALGAEAQT